MDNRPSVEKEEKLPAVVFLNFMPLRGAAQKRTDCGPLLTLHNQREHPLDTPRLGDSVLRPRTNSRFAYANC